jgi:hypothetical protein
MPGVVESARNLELFNGRSMRHNYERLAWTALLLSFAACLVLAIGAPWAAQWFVRNSYSGQFLILDVQEGTSLVTCPGTNVPFPATSPQEDLCQGRENIQITTGPADQGLLRIRSRAFTTTTLASIQIYRGTQILLQQAATPRFPGLSAGSDRTTLRVQNGRIRVMVPPDLARTMLFQVITPQTLVQLSEGSASVEVGNQETQVTVSEGKAFVVALANKSVVELAATQRVAVPTGSGVTSAMPAERNLLAGHNDFREPLGDIWKPYSLDPQIPGESRGEATNVNVDGRQAVDLSRIGQGFAETGIKQEINRDIRGFQSLQLRITLRVLQQDVPLCGTAGTECPVMVRVDYVDDNGDARFWQQGFYYLPDPNNFNPEFCNTCNPRNIHIRTISGVWYSYESDNLIPILTRVGSPPVSLKSISIYASGHIYQSQVAEVQLLGQE